MLFRLSSRWLVGLLMVVAVWAFLPAPLPADDEDQPAAEEAADEAEDDATVEEGQEPADETEPADEGEEAEEAGEEADPLALPEDASPENLAKFIERVQATRPEGSTRDEMIESFKKAQTAIIEASDKILEAEASDDLETTAVKAKLAALSMLGQFGAEGAPEQLAKFAEEMKADKRPDIAKEAGFYLLVSRFRQVDRENADEVKQLVADTKAYLKQSTIDARTAQLAMAAADVSAELDRQQAIEIYHEYAEQMANSDDPQLARAAEQFRSAARKLEMVGKPLEIEGTLVGGSEFDWSAYQGKVVLVDFWATWCGPCIEELPNVKETYEKYRDKGFEVVGISLDEDREALEQFLEAEKIEWTTLFGTSPEASGWNHPMAQRYGVDGIPMAVLVNREGNVVTLNARGEILPKLVGELVAQQPSDETSTKAAGKLKTAAGKQDKKPAAKKPSNSNGKDTPAAKKPAAKKAATKKPAAE